MTATRLLVVTAVTAERDRAAAGFDGGGAPGTHTVPGHTLLRTGGHAGHPLRTDLLAGGVGPAAAASAASAALTAAALRGEPYDLVVTAGIGGGFQPLAPIGAVVVADRLIAADLGADSPDGFLSVDALGFGRTVHHAPPDLSREAAHALGAVHGPVLTVSTATGSAETARLLAERHPGAAAEAMEGFGVAEAAASHGVPVLEIRTVSNAVGPRDRAAWRIGEAMAALTTAFAALAALLEKDPTLIPPRPDTN
ncbi:futalosine hydrolase [Streptomyces sp. SL13]|uniref:Futalosine hydrolase n=1 Tax=Streptantibioticus silvisoli TaxID=2705255 RepID=A0AA90H182_9ACTN|nr:futalosine hydrolase [Streptantibioticus silvisoli]MDI5963010.1 futalosine hydrolase [Streptantibioticus silvisoli]MDI5968725.1 futalosine hydrolase [Streptantibioticus silvisoli]